MSCSLSQLGADGGLIGFCFRLQVVFEWVCYPMIRSPAYASSLICFTSHPWHPTPSLSILHVYYYLQFIRNNIGNRVSLVMYNTHRISTLCSFTLLRLFYGMHLGYSRGLWDGLFLLAQVDYL